MDANDAQSPPQAPPSLDSLRTQIDALDDNILALLGKRAALGEELRKAKAATAGAALPIRPAREVALMRRLIAQAPASVERELVIEIWRALISASVRRQTDLEVLVAGANDPVRQFDLARRHFGAAARITRADDARRAMERLLEGAPAVAVLPWPGLSGPGGWWPILSESKFHRLGVIGGLPVNPGAVGEEPEAAVVAIDPVLEPAGGDTTLAIAFDPHYRCARALGDAHLPGKETARARTHVLIRLDGFVSVDDPRLPAAARAGLEGLRVIGACARL
jgi:chorismate mutase